MTFQSLKENNHPQIWIKEMKIVDYLMIGATIRIGQEILCLPYAGFYGGSLALIKYSPMFFGVLYATKGATKGASG